MGTDRAPATEAPTVPPSPTSNRSDQGRRTAVLTGVGVTVAYMALSLFCWQRLVGDGISGHIYELDRLGDVGQRIWFMAWLPFALGHHTNPLVSTYMFAPHGVNLLGNASVLLEAFLLAPVTVMWSPIAAFNVGCIVAPVLSALSLFYVLRRYEMHRSVAFVGGLAYGFSPALLVPGQIGDLNLSWMICPPLMMYLFDRIFFRTSGNPVRLGLTLGVLIVVQFFSGQEILLDCAVVAVPLLVVAMVGNRRQVPSHLAFAAKGAAATTLTAGALLAYPLAFYLSGPDHISTLSSSVSGGTALSSLVWPSTATGHGYLEPARGTSWLHLFDAAFVGPAVLGFALAALLIAGRRRVVLLLWAGALWCFVLSWGGTFRLSGSTTAHSFRSPAVLLSGVFPILKSVGWERISILTDLFLVVLAAISLERAVSAVQRRSETRRSEAWWRPGAGLVALSVGVVTVVPLLVASRVPFAPFESVAAPSALRQLPKTANGSPSDALVFPGGTWYNGAPLAWQAIAGFPYRDVQGYAWHPVPGSARPSVGPQGAIFYLTGNVAKFPAFVVLSPSQRRVVRLALEDDHVSEAVVIDGYAGSAKISRVYDQVLGPGRRVSDGEVWAVT